MKELIAGDITPTDDGRWRLWLNRRGGVKAMTIWRFEQQRLAGQMPHLIEDQHYEFDGPTIIFNQPDDAMWGLMRWA